MTFNHDRHVPDLYPDVAARSDGGYLIAWTSFDQDGSSSGIYAQRFDANGNPVGGETLTNTTTANPQEEPAIATLGDGSYVVTWMSAEQDGSGWGIYAQQYDASGNAKAGETRVNTTTLGGQTSADVAALAAGGCVVVWQSDPQDGSGHGVYAQRFDAQGQVVGGEVLVNTTTAGDQLWAAVADSGT